MKPIAPQNYRLPPGVAAAALLLWGMTTGHLVLAILIALLIEARRVIRTHWIVDEALIGRFWTLCTVLFVTSVVVEMIRLGAARAGFSAIAWMPLTLLPIMLVQVYGGHAGIPTRLLSAISRMQHRSQTRSGSPAKPDTLIHLEFPYVCIVLIAAGTPTPSNYLFYGVATALVALGLFINRFRPRVNLALWLCIMLIVVSVGHVGHIGLHNLHVYLENTITGIDISGQDRDSDRAMTRIGSIGELKQSTKIDWWMTVIQGKVPPYLRIATFDIFRRETWYAGMARELIPAHKRMETEWLLHSEADAEPNAEVQLQGRSQQDETKLAIPTRALALHALKAKAVAQRRTGLTLTYDTAPILNFIVSYQANTNSDLPPTERDLELPDSLAVDLTQVMIGLGLTNVPPRDVVNGLCRYFEENFHYSLYLDIDRDKLGVNKDPILQFLEDTRKGHCEYFATSTALLLRAAGIPARYVVGYSVSEYDKRRDQYLVRGLHAHAWVQAWVDGRWEYVDTTPGDWLNVENKALSPFQKLQDWLHAVPVMFAAWKESPTGRTVMACLKWAGIPLLAIYLWYRIFKGQRRPVAHDGTPADIIRPGMESAWYTLEPKLAERVGARGLGEPLSAWWRRVEGQCDESLRRSVDEAIALHYLIRFGEPTNPDAVIQQLEQAVARCLNDIPKNQTR